MPEPFPVAQALVHFVYQRFVQRQHLLVGGHRRPVSRGDAPLFAPECQFAEVRFEDHRGVFLAVAHHHRLVDVPGLHQGVFDRLRGDVFSARGLEQFLFAVGDVKETVLQVPDVPGVQVSVLVERLGGEFRFLVVAQHHARPFYQDLPVLTDAHVQVFERPADGPDAQSPLGVNVGRDDRAGLGQPVSLVQHDARCAEQTAQACVEAGRPADHDAQIAAQRRAPFVEDQPSRHRQFYPVAQTVFVRPVAHPQADCPVENTLAPTLERFALG